MSIKVEKNKRKTTKPAGRQVGKRATEEKKQFVLFGGFGDKQKEQFYREIHALITSGVDIKVCLDILAEEYPKKNIKQLIHELRDALIGGQSLSSAMEKKKEFSPYEYYNIRIGEESGSLPLVLEELSFYFKRKTGIQRQFLGAISYPVFIFSVTLGVLYFMMNFVVPMFADVFSRFGGELPDITKKVITLSEFFQSYSAFVFLGIIAVIGGLYSQREQLWFRKASSRFLLAVPVFGAIISKVYLNRFCLSMKILVAAKTPLMDALSMTKEMIGFYPLEHALEGATEKVFKGAPLHVSLGEYKVFPRRMISMIRVAEEINQLDSMFERLSDQMNEEIEHQTSIMGKIIEPVMIFVIALMVGFILISMYLPLFELSTRIN